MDFVSLGFSEIAKRDKILRLREYFFQTTFFTSIRERIEVDSQPAFTQTPQGWKSQEDSTTF
jgi:hypothetical protein